METTATTTIGEYEYTIRKLMGFKSLETLHALGKALGPAVGGALQGLALEDGKPLDLREVDAAALVPRIAAVAGGVLERVFTTMSAADLRHLTKELLFGATVKREDGTEAELLKVFDAHFQGRAFDVLALVKFAVEANYGSFFDVVRAAAARYLPRKRSADSSAISPKA